MIAETRKKKKTDEKKQRKKNSMSTRTWLWLTDDPVLPFNVEMKLYEDPQDSFSGDDPRNKNQMIEEHEDEEEEVK